MDILRKFIRRYLEAAGPDGGGAGGKEGEQPTNLIDATKGSGEGAPKEGDGAPAEWFWSDGVKGADKPPEWFKADKYKSVAEQARAYGELEKKHGELAGKLKGFTGAPEKYELAMPEDLKEQLEWRADDPLLTEFQAFAKEAGMSQETFAGILGYLAKYEYSNVNPDWAKEKAALGERADERLQGFTQWYESTMDEESASLIKIALGVNPSPADIFKALEAVRGADRQPSLNPGEDVRTTMTKGEWESKWYARSEIKGVQYKIDEPGAREKARAELSQIVGSGDHKVIVGGAKKAS